MEKNQSQSPKFPRKKALVLRDHAWDHTSLPQQLDELNMDARYSPCPSGAAAMLLHAEKNNRPFDLLLVESTIGSRDSINLCAALCLHLSNQPKKILISDANHGFNFSMLSKSGVDAVLSPDSTTSNLKRLLNSLFRLSA
ncbi:MAG: hypothetical protein QGF46_06005 [Planctomycetota bacterium]|jgi:hypothetical protein|nr:hypothetical protein [Planctomycetota bacterium]